MRTACEKTDPIDWAHAGPHGNPRVTETNDEAGYTKGTALSRDALLFSQSG